jgi:hypothetical protein
MNINNALVTQHEEKLAIATIVAESKMFAGQLGVATGIQSAYVKMMIAESLGVPAFVGLSQVYVIEGKPVMGSNLLAAQIKRSGKYDYRIAMLKDNQGTVQVDGRGLPVMLLSDEECVLEFFENGEFVGISSFTKADAERAGLLTKNNWKNHPSSMLFARALSAGQKRFCPEIGAGMPLYVEGEIIDVSSEEVGSEQPAIAEECPLPTAVVEPKGKAKSKAKPTEVTPQPVSTTVETTAVEVPTTPTPVVATVDIGESATAALMAVIPTIGIPELKFAARAAGVLKADPNVAQESQSLKPRKDWDARETRVVILTMLTEYGKANYDEQVPVQELVRAVSNRKEFADLNTTDYKLLTEAVLADFNSYVVPEVEVDVLDEEI